MQAARGCSGSCTPAVRALCARNCRVTWCVHYNMDKALPAQLARFLQRIRAATLALA
jgi:hypothetical protein